MFFGVDLLTIMLGRRVRQESFRINFVITRNKNARLDVTAYTT